MDGTNPNRNYRQLLHEYFVKQLGFKLLFVECVCDDDAILERNIKVIKEVKATGTGTKLKSEK